MFSPLDHRLRVVIGTEVLASSPARSCIHIITSASNHALAHFPMRRLRGKRPSRSIRQMVVRPSGTSVFSSLNRMYLI